MGENVRRQYEEDKDFRDYVDRYRLSRGVTKDEALEHITVKYAAEYYTDAKRDIIEE